MADNPWAWRDGHNPYRATPFQVLALSPEAGGRGAIRNHVRKRRQRIERRADRYPLFGRVLRVAEVNAAEDRIKDPAQRLLAQLCTHRPEPPARPERPDDTTGPAR
ncbi:hypothetical protein ACM01_32065 [Streptomyces viridochromogenes]|uniref:Uncharacterized protein n=1 Tax=Streptomyces viridochromogenes TaxID=1938 RepID=A0A0J7Z2S5_STRVR|nr:hypothetical protein [Streptomyces viridochromogenes]KMS70336.1 hypothetical protein ACM01_32065 [Streptomyces viridochromogenes]KOG17092.1 hypothetical protein ADK35_24850 [Streptomyces viridochromogenes]KOG20113.1 hypothetical protein ADK36_17510 [Streptomyces viridochromogenes]